VLGEEKKKKKNKPQIGAAKRHPTGREGAPSRGGVAQVTKGPISTEKKRWCGLLIGNCGISEYLRKAMKTSAALWPEQARTQWSRQIAPPPTPAPTWRRRAGRALNSDSKNPYQQKIRRQPRRTRPPSFGPSIFEKGSRLRFTLRAK